MERGKLYINSNSGSNGDIIIMCTEDSTNDDIFQFKGVIVESYNHQIFPVGEYGGSWNKHTFTELENRAVVLFNTEEAINNMVEKVSNVLQTCPRPQPLIKGALTGLEIILGIND
jgi:hypothetical protein